MAIKVNVFCNGQIAANDRYLKHFDEVNWGPGGVKRDALGLPIKDDNDLTPSREVGEDADLQK